MFFKLDNVCFHLYYICHYQSELFLLPLSNNNLYFLSGIVEIIHTV